MDQKDEVNEPTDPGAAPLDLRAIGPRIVDLRNRLGLTQRALARQSEDLPDRENLVAVVGSVRSVGNPRSRRSRPVSALARD